MDHIHIRETGPSKVTAIREAFHQKPLLYTKRGKKCTPYTAAILTEGVAKKDERFSVSIGFATMDLKEGLHKIEDLGKRDEMAG